MLQKYFHTGHKHVQVEKMTMANDEDDDMENLMEQMESIHMKVKFSCEDCDAGFDEEGYLQQHRKKKHDDVLKPF